ncbi:uncharacterized protein LOC128959468 [Oppia nitens]|uniref:uncharacterized protein LOC128959468 n=1 Tax=Oppia nitens TaxID=1686743 RepID=UPI0023DA0CA5|nr:uncharacterized protein LOC128959468 [Oppia nitens]
MSEIKSVIIIITINLIVCANCVYDLIEDRIKRVRQDIIKWADDNPNDVDTYDLEHIKAKDFIIERYLMEYNFGEKEAMDKIISALKFYKSEGLAQLDDQYFPSEFYATGWLIRHGVSKTGGYIVGFCNRCMVPYNDVSWKMFELGRKFVAYFLYKNRMELDKGPRLGYNAMNDTGIVHIDIRLVKFIAEYLNYYMPQTSLTCIVTDMPFAVAVPFKLVVNLLSPKFKNKVVYTKMSDIGSWIDTKEIPQYCGGKYKNFSRIPEGVKSGKCLTHLNHIPAKDWIEFRKQNIKCIKEGMRDMGIKSVIKYLNIDC